MSAGLVREPVSEQGLRPEVCVGNIIQARDHDDILCRCELHGQCKNGTCLCVTGWNGRHCTIQGCPRMCSDHGRCTTGHFSLPGAGALSGDWRCECDLGWDGADCATRLETQCGDGVDNDGGEIIIIIIHLNDGRCPGNHCINSIQIAP